jgi:flavin reductase (DIM6/NTAB) family NADH-FMN oxidoreductase RutF
MSKVKLGQQRFTILMPVVLVGTNVDGRANFMTVASCGEACAEPPMISVAVRHQRHTHRGIRQNMTFSVNVPSAELIKEADYCGIASGVKADKAQVCGFKVFYGKLGTAPLIEECPVNLECKVVHILNLGTHSLFIGVIEEMHIAEDFLTDGRPDTEKLKPFIYTIYPIRQYLACGQSLGKAFSIGKELDSEGTP